MIALLSARAGAALLHRCIPYAILALLFLAFLIAGPFDRD